MNNTPPTNGPPVIETHAGGYSIIGPENVRAYREVVMLHALRAEVAGFRLVRHSVYAQVKREYGFKGSKAKVLALLEASLVGRGFKLRPHA